MSMAEAIKRKPRRMPGNYSFLSKYTYYVPGVAEMFILLAFLLLGSIIGNVITSVFTLALGQEAALEYGMLIAYPVMFIPAMMYASAKSGRNSFNKEGIKLDSSNFSPVGGALCATVVAVATLALGFCTDALTGLLPQMPEFLEDMLKSMTSGTLWINLLSVSVFAPLFEEWLCRGMVLRGLLGNKMKPVWAIIISAAFFAFIHLNPWQALPAFLLGLLFGYVYYRTGSLKLTMLMHCVNNTFAVILSNIPALEEMESWQDVLSTPLYWLIFAACLMLVVLSLMLFKKIPLKRESGNSDSVPCLFSE